MYKQPKYKNFINNLISQKQQGWFKKKKSILRKIK